MSMPTAELVRKMFHYDPETGVFTRLVPTKRNPVGSVVSGRHLEGYLCAWIDGAHYKLHRVAWLYVYGSWPDGHVDHINGVRSDNRMANLRLATPHQTTWNRSILCTNKSGFKGVSKILHHATPRPWRAKIYVHNRQIHLGCFPTAEEAHAAYVAAAEKHFGEFARDPKAVNLGVAELERVNKE